MIELVLGAIVTGLAITFGIVFLWAIVRAPFAIIGAIFAERDRTHYERRKQLVAVWLNMCVGADIKYYKYY